MQQIICNIAIDDIHPQKGWRILGDKTEIWLRKLNEEFGAKFDLFVPSNWHGEFPLSKNKSWIEELDSMDEFVGLNFHGHFHQCKDPRRFGECEFAELNNTKEISDRITAMWLEWMAVECKPFGFRPPGWVISNESQRMLNNDTFIIRGSDEIGWERSDFLNFDFVAVHYEHNRGMKWNCPTFFGHDGIHQTDISIHNVSEKNPMGMVMFQSHIAGDHNDNVWNEKNYEQLRLSLLHLTENYNVEFKLLNECL